MRCRQYIDIVKLNQYINVINGTCIMLKLFIRLSISKPSIHQYIDPSLTIIHSSHQKLMKMNLFYSSHLNGGSRNFSWEPKRQKDWKFRGFLPRKFFQFPNLVVSGTKVTLLKMANLSCDWTVCLIIWIRHSLAIILLKFSWPCFRQSYNSIYYLGMLLSHSADCSSKPFLYFSS